MAVKQDAPVPALGNTQIGRAVIMSGTARLKAITSHGTSFHQCGKSFHRHDCLSSRGLVFSAITRRTSVIGTNRRRPIFTLATTPE
jgi:hypothetical protein